MCRARLNIPCHSDPDLSREGREREIIWTNEKRWDEMWCEWSVLAVSEVTMAIVSQIQGVLKKNSMSADAILEKLGPRITSFRTWLDRNVLMNLHPGLWCAFTSITILLLISRKALSISRRADYTVWTPAYSFTGGSSNKRQDGTDGISKVINSLWMKKIAHRLRGEKKGGRGRLGSCLKPNRVYSPNWNSTTHHRSKRECRYLRKISYRPR